MKWQNLVKNTAQQHQKRPYQIDVKLDLQIDWFSKKSGNLPDVDNILKPIIDALRNVIYADDNQVSLPGTAVKFHDINSILWFNNEPLSIIEPLLNGEKEYVFIRAYRVY